MRGRQISTTAPDSDSPHVLDSADSPVSPGDLTERYFECQNERPDHLADADLTAMNPFLRSLLFTDGTVTRALEVQSLSRVCVEIVAQTRSVALGHVAKHLEIGFGSELIERRVTIGLGVDEPANPMILAESHIVPDRLPPGFLGLLGDTPDGIGQSMQQVRLESWREMLWYGFDTPPEWYPVSPHATPTVLKRLYRVITGDLPAILISESFAVENRSGTYHLTSIC